jgi:hypothetical protein
MGISIARRGRCGSGRDAEDGNLEGYPLELFEWGMAINRYAGLPTWCEIPCGSKVGFGLGPQDEIDARVMGLGSGDVLTQLAAGVRDQA